MSKQRPEKPASDASFELRMETMAHGGHSLGWKNKQIVFVPYTIPGEAIRARIREQRGRVTYADGIELIDASADRVAPECSHFGPGRCWGCQWQHISYKAQRLLKQDVLADQLARLGRLPDAVIDRAMRAVMPSPQLWGYNQHITFSRGSDGRFGLPSADGRVLTIDECPVTHPDLIELYSSFDFDFADVSQIQLLRGSDGATMIALRATRDDAPELSIDFPTSANLILPDNEPLNLIGHTLVNYVVGERSFRVTVGSFFRANVAALNNTIPVILEMLALQSSDSVLDLYAGVGVYSAFLALRAELVTLVESYPPAVTDADVNLADFDNVDVVEGSVEDFLAAMVDEGAIYDAAVVDPSGGGLSREALQHLCELGPGRLVYVSSDPATLARDASALLKAGYELIRVQPVDMAPHTYYIDAICLFQR